jgi:tetratricopeptide (TPR) repeat protein
VQLVDAVEALTGPGAGLVPGEESFHEHVHLNFDGNYRLARAWAAAIAARFPDLGSGEKASNWAPAEVCAQRLGLTDWNRQAALEEVARRLSEAPFTNQFNHPARMERLRAALLGLRQRVQAQDPQDARRLYEAAIRARPTDHWLHHNYAEFLTRIEDWEAATAEMERVRDLAPQHYGAYLQMGRLLARQKRFADAHASLREALRRRPDLAEAHVELGQLAAGEKQFDEALAEFDAAIRLRPDDAATYLRRADVLMALKRRDAAIESLRTAIRWRPSAWEAHFLLGLELSSEGRVSEAGQAFAEAVRLRPEHVLARLNLGNLLARQGRWAEARSHFEEVLRREPENAAAQRAIADLPQLPPSATPP